MHSRRLAGVAAAMLGLFLIGCAGIYLAQPSSAFDSVPVTPPDPLAARRPRPSAPDMDPPPVAPGSAAQRALNDAGVEGMESNRRSETEGALDGLRAAIEQYPEDAEARSTLGHVLVGLGRLDEAVPHLRGAVTLNPGRAAYRANLGRALAQLRRWDESIASYREALEVFPDDHVTTLELAEALHTSGQSAAAADEYRKAIALHREDPSSRMALANSYERLQQTEDAARAYEEYLRLSPSAPDAQEIRARIDRLTEP